MCWPHLIIFIIFLCSLPNLVVGGFIFAIIGVVPRFKRQRNGLLLGASICLLIIFGIIAVIIIIGTAAPLSGLLSFSFFSVAAG